MNHKHPTPPINPLHLRQDDLKPTYSESAEDGGGGAGRDFSEGGGAEGNWGGGAEGRGGVFCRRTCGGAFSKLEWVGLGGGVASVTLALGSSRSRLMEEFGVNSSSGKKSKLESACCNREETNKVNKHVSKADEHRRLYDYVV